MHKIKIIFAALSISLLGSCSYSVDTFKITSTYNQKNLRIIHGENLETHLSLQRLEKIKIAVIDSGYQNNPELNINLHGKISEQNQYHGMYVANIIGLKKNITTDFYGLVPGIQIEFINIPNDDLNNLSLTKAIQEAIDLNIQLINISLTTNQFDNKLYDAVKDATDKGITVIASAGNSGTNELEYPAAFYIPGVISVGAVNQELNIPDFSTINSKIDVFAPGQDIYTLDPESKKVKALSGSSLATPFVTMAAILLIAKYPNLTPLQVESDIRRSSDVVNVYWGFECIY